jgi:hypothetical protein
MSVHIDVSAGCCSVSETTWWSDLNLSSGVPLELHARLVHGRAGAWRSAGVHRAA